MTEIRSVETVECLVRGGFNRRGENGMRTIVSRFRRIMLRICVTLACVNSYSQPLQWQHVLETNERLEYFAVSGSNVMYSGGNALYRSTDEGMSWNLLASGFPGGISGIATTDDSKFYVGTSNGLYVGSDTDSTLRFGYPNFSITGIATSRQNYIYLATAADGLYRSMDRAQSFGKVDVPFHHSESLSVVVIHRDTIYAANYQRAGSSSFGFLYRYGQVDNYYIEQNSFFILYNTNYEPIHTVSFSRRNDAFVTAVKYGIHRRYPDGYWTLSNSGLTFEYIYSRVVENSAGDLFVGTVPGGVFKSTDRAASWQNVSGDIPSRNVTGVFVDLYDHLLVATEDMGIFRSSGPTTGIQSDASPPPNFSLNQNYPNPFNPTTQIRFSIVHGTSVLLKIYDVLGREVSTPVNRYMTAGLHEVAFNGENLLGGIYVYRLTAGSKSETRKMVLVR